MLLSRIAETSAALAQTAGRRRKRELIAETLREADAGEIDIVVCYLSGSLRQRRTGVGWAALRQAPDPAAESELSVVAVDAAFEQMAGLSGAGSAATRAAAVNALFGAATSSEQKLLAGLIFSDLRQGALDAVVQEGLALAFELDLSLVHRAAMLLGSTPAAAVLAARGGEQALLDVGLQVGVPISPMLAASAPDPAAASDKLGLPAIADFKLDGIRVQVHRDRDQVSIYTRSLDDITARLPGVVDVVRGLPNQHLVLDGEVLAHRADGRPEIFQVIASRTATQGEGLAADELPLTAYFFDLLHVDGLDLLDRPLTERAQVMSEVLPAAMIVPREEIGDAERLVEVFGDAVRRGYEGLVVKSPTASYAAGRRDASWIKIKPRHTFDLVVIAAEWGHGRREGVLSNLHLAARDSETGEMVMLGKTFKGLTDQLLAWQTEQFLQRETSRTEHTVYLKPELVVEIAIDGVQRSTRYPGGVALRFARVLRYRPDKTPDQADTVAAVRELLV